MTRLHAYAAGVQKAAAGGGSSNDPNFSNVTLLLHLDGANGGTTFTDSSPLMKSISTAGTTPTLSTTQAKFGTASLRANTTGSITTTNRDGAFDVGSSNFTIECWYYYIASEAVAYGTLFDGGRQSLSCQFADTTDKLIFFSNQATGMPSTGVLHGMTEYAWNHLAFVRNGADAYIFVNGTKIVYSTTVSGSITPSTAADTIATIGNAAQATLNNAYKAGGYIDDFRFTKGVARYTANFTVPTAAYPNVGQGGADSNFSSVALLLHMDGASGGTTFTDVKGTSVTATSATLNTTTYKFGTAAGDFGTSSRLTFPTISLAGDYTLECWLYRKATDSPSGYGILFSSSSNYQTPYIKPDGSVGWSGPGFGALITGAGAGTIGRGAWIHLAFCRAGSTVTMFVNGTQTATFTESGTLTISTISGYGSSGSTYNMHAYIDDLRITNGVARYSANFTPPTAAFPNA